jgi:hypothetical protein
LQSDFGAPPKKCPLGNFNRVFMALKSIQLIEIYANTGFGASFSHPFFLTACN